MKRYVLKFGGSSVETIDKMKLVAARIISKYNKDTELVVVVSAMGKTTNKLFSEARKITLLPNKRDLDLLLATGEMVSIALLSMILNDMGYPAVSLTGPKAKIYTTGEFQNSKIDKIDPSEILKHLKDKKIVIVAGYQGVNSDGDITTLGREGSDTSAVNLAYYLNCPCEIYSDVEGVFEVDPKVLPISKKHERLSYNETLLLSYYGAKVIATSAIEFASNKKVPLYLGSTFNEEATGTIVSEEVKEQLEFAGIVVQHNQRILRVLNGLNYGTLEEISNYGIKVDLIKNNLIALTSDDLIILEEAINNEFDDDEYEEEYVDYNLVKVTVIGKVLESEEVVNELIRNIDEEMINVVFTKHNRNRLSIFISIDDTYLCIKKLYKKLEGIVKNEEET